MSSVWRIYYDFLSATTKLLSPKSLASFRQNALAFISPKAVAVPVRAQVARFIVNNRPETMVRSRRPFHAAAGWFSPWLRLPKRHWLRFAKMRRALMLRSIAARAQTLAQVGCSRLGHSILPISGKPEIGCRPHPSRCAHAAFELAALLPHARSSG